MGLFDRLKNGLQKTKEVLRTDVRDLFKAGEILDDEFIMLDDDNRPIKEIDLSYFITVEGRYNAYYYYDLLNWHHRETAYDEGQHQLKKILSDKNYELLSYSCHAPQIINKALFSAAVEEFFKPLFGPAVDEILVDGHPHDPKSLLQEWTQARTQEPSVYQTINETGPDHEKIFEVKVSVEGIVSGTGKGNSKREASKLAAKEALDKLSKLNNHPSDKY